MVEDFRDIKDIRRRFSTEAVDENWIYLSKWTGLPIHCRPYIKIPYVLDGKLHIYTSFIEGFPALDNIPEPMLRLFIETYDKECKQTKKELDKSKQKANTSEDIKIETLERELNEKRL